MQSVQTLGALTLSLQSLWRAVAKVAVYRLRPCSAFVAQERFTCVCVTSLRAGRHDDPLTVSLICFLWSDHHFITS